MANKNDSDEPLKELRHNAVPGYLKVFTIAFGVMGLYLAIILISSPGSAKHHDYGKGDATHSSEGKH